MVLDVRLELVAEVADHRQHRVGRRLAEAAQGGLLDLLAEVDEPLDVALFALAVADARDDLEHALGAHAARRALAAALILDEVEEVARHVDHAGVLVHDDEAARAHDGAQLLQVLVVDRHVEVLLGDAAARGAAELHGLEGLAAGHAAADLVHQLAELHADRHFDQAGVLDVAAQREHLGALAALRAERRIPLRALEHDRRNIGERLDVVEHAGLAPEALVGRERRPRTRLAALALDRRHERSLFTADEGARAHADLEVEVEARAHDVVAQQAVLARLVEREVEALDGQRVLGAHVDVALMRADRVGADDHALDEAVGIAFEHRAVHERARVALVTVAEHVLHVAGRVVGELPLHAGREAGAAAAAQAAGEHLGDHLLRCHLGEDLGHREVTVAGDVLLDLEGVDHARVAQGDLHLTAEELDVLDLGDGGAAAGVLVDEPVDDTALEDVLLDDLGAVFDLDLLVEDTVRVDDGHRPCFAGAEAAGLDDGDLAVEVVLFEALLEGSDDVEGA